MPISSAIWVCPTLLKNSKEPFGKIQMNSKLTLKILPNQDCEITKKKAMWVGILGPAGSHITFGHKLKPRPPQYLRKSQQPIQKTPKEKWNLQWNGRTLNILKDVWLWCTHGPQEFICRGEDKMPGRCCPPNHQILMWPVSEAKFLNKLQHCWFKKFRKHWKIPGTINHRLTKGNRPQQIHWSQIKYVHKSHLSRPIIKSKELLVSFT